MLVHLETSGVMVERGGCALDSILVSTRKPSQAEDNQTDEGHRTNTHTHTATETCVWKDDKMLCNAPAEGAKLSAG